jgi:hypothetical protein
MKFQSKLMHLSSGYKSKHRREKKVCIKGNLDIH